MNEIIDIAFSRVNISLSILFALLLLYWILTTVSGIDFDFDMDVDVDVDVDADVDMDTDFDARTNIDVNDVSNTEVRKEDVVRRRGKLNFFQIFLIYFNFVGLPFMFTLTFWVLFWWALTMTGTYLTGSYDTTFGFIFFFGAIFPALFLTKIFTTPFKSFFKNFNSDGETSLELLGRVGILNTAISEDKIATLEVTIEGSPIKVYVKSKNGKHILANTQVEIVNQTTDKKIYLIKPYYN
ncbi:hypothetical protein GTQ40_09685 [Flavobacteriaceae bacterium R38]|nr:hypothetical protein [Flavobacteriaceae bacterium R38]